jgi:hypothetical protein
MNATENNLVIPSYNAPSISSSAMLVEINRRRWNGYARNKDATEKVRQDYNAGRKSARVNQTLLINEPVFDRVNTLYGALGTTLYHYTMPWLDRGPRLLTTPMFMAFNKAVTEIINEIENDALPAFFAEYPNMIARAGDPDRLGALFNFDHYPDVDTLRDHYSINLKYAPVPEVGDFRVDIGAEALAQVRESYESSYKEQLESAYKDVWERTHEALTNMSNRLEGEKKQGKFHESLVTNITDMVDLLDKFNITNDPNMARAKVQIAQAMRGVTIDGLKEDDYFRLETKAKVDNLLKSFEW